MLELLISALLALLNLNATATEQPVVVATTTATVVRVIDGDTIEVDVDGTTERVRYIGIDTPEPRASAAPECFAAEATAANQALVADTTVQLVADVENRDDYNRLLRYVYVDGRSVNEALVRDGYATTLPIPPNTLHAQQLRELELSAQQMRRGLWGACNVLDTPT